MAATLGFVKLPWAGTAPRESQSAKTVATFPRRQVPYMVPISPRAARLPGCGDCRVRNQGLEAPKRE
jgi:hypothetical protein